MAAEWTPGRDGGWDADVNGWGLRVYLDEDLFSGDLRWFWSAMQFVNPGDETDDRIVIQNGSEETKAKAMRAAESAAEEA